MKVKYQKKDYKMKPMSLKVAKKRLQELENLLKGDSLKNWSHKSLRAELHADFVRGNESGLKRCRAEMERRELLDYIGFLKGEKECFFCEKVKKTRDLVGWDVCGDCQQDKSDSEIISILEN